ncbi:MAG TPA: 4-hydroxy-tetrahydrodipicolinate synthase [Prolixibacteraceae bacterium]|nr:4-hydroxy-tetrahydrodipicolinate synthase [Prolixibacteraceae bacterium]HPR59421.1 4-hydroxy-tetrahydrodipicolinate synthase [Prolixibacteraceae bacterium]
MEHLFKGTGPALITPFKSNDLSIDFDALDQTVEYQISNGINFIVALGTTAETATLSHEERHQVYNFVKSRNNKRLPLMVGFGGNNTAEVIAHIKSANFDGIDAILSVVPYYNKPTQEGLYRHFMALAQVCPVPIILYNVPSRTGVNLSSETTLRLANDSKKFIGIKEASGDIKQIKNIIDNTPDEFLVLSGDDAMIEPIAQVGGNGVISVMANAFPAQVVELANKALQKDPEAKVLQQKYADLINLLFVEGNPAGVKAALHQMKYIENILRLPLCPVGEITYNEIAAQIKSL